MTDHNSDSYQRSGKAPHIAGQAMCPILSRPGDRPGVPRILQGFHQSIRVKAETMQRTGFCFLPDPFWFIVSLKIL